MSLLALPREQSEVLRSPPERPAGGGSPERDQRHELVAAYPFSTPVPITGEIAWGESGEPAPAHSAVEALEKVEFSPQWDLRGQRAYLGARIERVWLRRCRHPGSGGDDAIFVFSPDVGDPSRADVRSAHLLGVLRPVQRFVLAQGLGRAQRVAGVWEQRVDLDRWGFVRVRAAGAKRVTITPPIVERLHSCDWDDASGAEEFVICDGTHRLVKRCWIDRQPLPALAVLPGAGQIDLPQPYYARPLGRLDWELVSRNRLTQTPGVLGDKYTVRAVALEEVLDREIVRAVEVDETAAEQLYRRYFRELSTGFGYLGSQGGREE